MSGVGAQARCLLSQLTQNLNPACKVCGSRAVSLYLQAVDLRRKKLRESSTAKARGDGMNDFLKWIGITDFQGVNSSRMW